MTDMAQGEAAYVLSLIDRVRGVLAAVFASLLLAAAVLLSAWRLS